MAVEASALDRWAASAAPRARIVYATGPELPREAPAVSLARRLADVGLVTLTTEAIEGGRNYIAVRLPFAASTAPVALDPLPEDALAARVLQRLRRAANLDQVCPTNAELARECGLKDAAVASYRIRKLIAAGKIRVEDQGPNARRIVTIVATGRRTMPGAL
jgi:hypothetical protein